MEIVSKLLIPSLISILVGYLIGSLSFSIILTRIISRQDIRTQGSGNAGATNVLRSVGLHAAVITFVLDFLKCVLAIAIGYQIFKYTCNQAGISLIWVQIGKYAAGVGCMLGHIKPLYFHFKGGKGVTTAAALVLLLDWRVFIPAVLTFIIVFALKKIVSLASVLGMGLYPVYTFLIMFLFDYKNSPLHFGREFSMLYILCITLASFIIGGIILFTHIPNIKRLRNGEEKQISFKK
ncbi:glycerol-3-phosphate 1-O-acyltransferase PlsY [Scatolibacter rhodanostii]|uniref:glycerol-3-phosphate 1-O-acyltransferase PlsY n=1 Tax=Scatolibacter rhodanostii TaxID=2014781 RepID=UPI000C085BEF|nr:glycerol-3-phosphate 1-O-acyltransferase PlsY [Scatolibacter rhodanostii]